MSDFGIVVDGGVRFERLITRPPREVWPFLVEPQLLSEWLGVGEFDATPGGRLMLRSGGGPFIRGTVLVCDEPRFLSYGWNVFLPSAEHPVAVSVVTWELQPRGGDTGLIFVQSPIEHGLLANSLTGWHALLDILGAIATGYSQPDFMKIATGVREHYETLVGGN